MKAVRLGAAASDCEINRSTYAVMHLQETWDMAANEKPPVKRVDVPFYSLFFFLTAGVASKV